MAKNIRKVDARWVEGKEFETTTDSGHHIVTDSTVLSGGKNRGASPMELMLVGLAGCTGMDVIDILKKKRQTVKGLQVQVEGMRSEGTPSVYHEIEVSYTVRGKNIAADAVKHAIHLSETKYCSVGAMLGKTAKIKTRFEILET